VHNPLAGHPFIIFSTVRAIGQFCALPSLVVFGIVCCRQCIFFSFFRASLHACYE
jgi:hypothetical protein